MQIVFVVIAAAIKRNKASKRVREGWGAVEVEWDREQVKSMLKTGHGQHLHGSNYLLGQLNMI